MLDFRKSSINSALRKVLKRFHYPLEVMLTCVRWYVAYPLSLRHIEEMMQERGVFVDHATVHRWTIKMVPVLAAVFRRRKHPVGKSWRMDETYIKVAGQWKYLYRVVDSAGDTVDFLLTAKRDIESARVLRRQNTPRGPSYEQEIESFFTRGSRACSAHGARAQFRVPVAVGCCAIHRTQDRLHA